MIRAWRSARRGLRSLRRPGVRYALVAVLVAILWLVMRYRTETIAAAVAIVALVALWGIRRRLRFSRVRDWHDAERATATWLRRAGCRRVRLTSPGADGGIDVLTRQLAVQVKHTERRVGRPALQQLVGAAISLDRQPALFSTAGFTAPAHDYAVDHEVALFELDLDGRAHPANDVARSLRLR